MSSDNSFIDSLLQVFRLLRRHYDDCAQNMGLTMARARVITALVKDEGASQTELSRRLEIEPPTLKLQLDALEADGFVERRAIEGDARKNALFLTEKGRANDIIAFGKKLRSDVLDGITPEELEQARNVLDRIASNIAVLEKK